MRELFIIDRKAMEALTQEEVNATVVGLEEMGLLHLPFDEVDIQVPMDHYGLGFKSKKEMMESELGVNKRAQLERVLRDGHYIGKGVSLKEGSNPEVFMKDVNGTMISVRKVITDQVEGREWAEIVTSRMAGALITLLATRNSIKTRKENKLARLGIGTKNPMKAYRYTTTITLPEKLEDDHTCKGTGSSKRPHLRRGHKRNQHYGPHGQYTKEIWVDPVFVNADEGYISTRKAYNLSQRD